MDTTSVVVLDRQPAPWTGARHAGSQGLGHPWSEQGLEDDGHICVEYESLWA